jgi:hypothetical protein
MATQHNVVKDGHALEECNILECACHTEGGNAARGKVGNVPPLKCNGATVRVIETTDHIQQGGLTSAVGANNRDDLTPIDIHTDPIYRHDTTEMLGRVSDAQNDLSWHRVSPRVSTDFPHGIATERTKLTTPILLQLALIEIMNDVNKSKGVYTTDKNAMSRSKWQPLWVFH